MKKVSLLGTVLFAGLFAFGVASTASAQSPVYETVTDDDNLKTSFGIKAGVNLSNLTLDDENLNSESSKFGFHGGFFLKAPITEFFSIQPELLYSNKGTRARYNSTLFGNDGESRFNLHYLEVPVSAVINFGMLNIHGGVYGSYLAAATVTNVRYGDDMITTGGRDLQRGDFNDFDYGVLGGIGLDIDRFTVGVRYSYGLREVGRSTISNYTNNAHNNVGQLYVGVAF
jgi:hypothetical protein